MASSLEPVVQKFLVQEKQWTSVVSVPVSGSRSLPLFHGRPSKRVYVSDEEQKRYLRALSSIKKELESLAASSPQTPDDIARQQALKTQLCLLETYYKLPQVEFVAYVPMASVSGSAQRGSPVDYISGDVLAATFSVIKQVKDGHDSGVDDKHGRDYQKILWERGRATGETNPPSEAPLRLVLAVVDSDSTIMTYFVHDGMVPPRQN